MNKETISKKIMRIMQIALNITDLATDNGGKRSTCVFVELAPHCNRLDIRICRNGWRVGRTHDEDYYTYYNREGIIYDEYENYITLDGMIEILEKLEKECKE